MHFVNFHFFAVYHKAKYLLTNRIGANQINHKCIESDKVIKKEILQRH